jgi:RHS repeat-associated protein
VARALADGTKQRYTYDAWNRLVSVDDEDPENPTTLAAYEYDGLGRRIRQIVGPGGVVHTLHSYYNAEWQELEVRKEVSGTEDPDPLEQLVWHPYYIDALAVRWYDADTNPASVTEQYAIHDANYNVTALVSTTGAVLERYEYDPYGKLTVLTSTFTADGDNRSDSLNGTTYTGRKLDVTSTTTGLYDYRHRVYDPGLGRFVQRDPIEYRGGQWVLYGYVGGRSVSSLDPSGLERIPYPGPEPSPPLPYPLPPIIQPPGSPPALPPPGPDGPPLYPPDDFGPPFDFDPNEPPPDNCFYLIDEYTSGQMLFDGAAELCGVKLVVRCGKSIFVKVCRRCCKKVDNIPPLGRGGCFVAGTNVETEHGPRDIESLSVGDRVWAYDQAEDKWSLQAVSATHEHDYTGDIVSLGLDKGSIEATVEATGNHPFWVIAGVDLGGRAAPEDVYPDERALQADGRWIAARDLRPGDVLLTRDGERATIEHLAMRHDQIAVYNITVEDVHTYTVGAFDVLVHNKPHRVQPPHPKPDYPKNPLDPPGPDWEWRGNGPPGSGRGSWYKECTSESLFPDLGHGPPTGPHWDWKDPDGNWWRIFPDGRVEPK